MFGISWQEAASDSINDVDRKQYFSSVYKKTLTSICSIVMVLLACNFILFDFMFDPGYSDARLYLPILGISIVFVVLGQFFGGIQIGLKKPKQNGISTAVGAAINLVLTIGLMPAIGLYAACVSTLIANIAIAAIRILLLRKVVSARLGRRGVTSLLLLLYFFSTCYIDCGLMFETANLIVAVICFFLLNKSFVIAAGSKLVGGGRR